MTLIVNFITQGISRKNSPPVSGKYVQVDICIYTDIKTTYKIIIKK